MGSRYKDNVNYVAHNINNTTILLNKETPITGLELFEAELDDDENTTDKAADGTAIFVENPSTTGQIRITFLEASSVTDEVFTLLDGNTSFQISAKDDAATNFDVHGTCKIMKRPAVSRGALPAKPEWIFVCTYLTIKGGSYALATV